MPEQARCRCHRGAIGGGLPTGKPPRRSRGTRTPAGAAPTCSTSATASSRMVSAGRGAASSAVPPLLKLRNARAVLSGRNGRVPAGKFLLPREAAVVGGISGSGRRGVQAFLQKGALSAQPSPAVVPNLFHLHTPW